MADSFRYIHAADLHIDSPLRGLSRYEGIPQEQVRGAPREAFLNLIDRALHERVDFMILAGDVLDGDIRDVQTGIFLTRQFARLHQAGIPVYIKLGNHDAESELLQTIQWPANVQVFGHRKPQTFTLPQLKVAIHGQSFREPEVLDNLASNYPPPVPGHFNIGVLHTALEGNAEHKRYAPCALAELAARGYDYWALGHVHEFCVLSQAPWIVFPGNLQGRHIREAGPKGAVLVEVSGSDVQVERLLVDVMRWQRVTVDVSGKTSLRDCLDAAGRALAEAHARHSAGLPLAVRLRLEGACPAHGELASKVSELRTEVLLRAAQVSENLWIEKVVRDTLPPAQLGAASGGSDAVEALVGYVRDGAVSLELQAQLLEELGPDVARFEQEAIEASPLLTQLRAGETEELLRRATDDAIGRLFGVGSAA